MDGQQAKVNKIRVQQLIITTLQLDEESWEKGIQYQRLRVTRKSVGSAMVWGSDTMHACRYTNACNAFIQMDFPNMYIRNEWEDKPILPIYQIKTSFIFISNFLFPFFFFSFFFFPWTKHSQIFQIKLHAIINQERCLHTSKLL